MKHTIEVSYTYYTTRFSISKVLATLEEVHTLALDFETQAQYSLEERAEAKLLVKKHQDELSSEDLRLSKVVANCSGLSHPKIVKITHVIFGLSESEAIIIIINDHKAQKQVLEWIVQYKGKFLIHNSLFDLKLVHYHTGKLPKDVEDTQLAARCLINHTQDWHCKTGLKHLMGGYYDPKWTLIDSYDIQDYKDEAFLRYCAIDGASTFKLWEQLQEHLKEDK